MSTNLARYEADLARLVEEGQSLLAAMQYEVAKAEATKHIQELLGDKADNYISKLPKFNSTYQGWYSEARSVVRQLIPDRLADFTKNYETPQNRKTLGWENYTIEDYLHGLRMPGGVSREAALTRMEQQLNIVASAKQRFKSSLFDIQQLAMADLFDSEIESAKALSKKKFLRAAGAVAGVVLEKHLAQICRNHNVLISKKNLTIADLNDALRTVDVIDIPRWRATQHLADLRNLCDHNKSKEPTVEQVEELVEGVAKVLKTLF
ncbi:hypothetical protein [Sediminicoccus sp. KRV36]|uniref:hypothetical protein n=1 Tax=Sediminicoccus sp. KRV36 TaxID=3133721 RepID=UPI0020102288|nr:hypothetical protein [Sediminicoccus rosea]UPY36348.1 hypothetical protein LHU95_19340 [Sediminicoccus rosea]